MARVSSEQRRARPRPQPHRSRLAVLAVLLPLLTTSLSGCVVADFFLPQPPEKDDVRTGSSLVRVWAAAKPGNIGNEFAHLNVTFGPLGHARDPFVSQIVPMNGTATTVDMLRLERESQAIELASIVVPSGTYYGLTYRVLGATLAQKEVIGNDGGEPVTRTVSQDIAFNPTPGLLRHEHYVPAETVVDLYLEFNIVKSLIEQEGEYAHVSAISGISYYINGHKAGEKPLEADAFTGRRDPGRGSPPIETLPLPIAHFRAFTADGEMHYDSYQHSKRMERAVGRGEDIRFVTDAYSQTTFDGVPTRITELVWNFGDGTTAAGSEVTHNFTSGGMYDVSLAARDELGLVGRHFGTVFVPYSAAEATRSEIQTRAGTFLFGSATVGQYDGFTQTRETFTFPSDLEAGDLRIGGYRLTVRFADPTGSLTSAGTTMRMHVTSGELDHEAEGQSPRIIETAAFPFWRWPMREWVQPTIDVDLELLTGVNVDYELTVEALYYENMSRGHDQHAAHRHGEWRTGPYFHHLEIDGTVAARAEEE